MISAVLILANQQRPVTPAVNLSGLAALTTEQLIEKGDFFYKQQAWTESSATYQILIDRQPRQGVNRFRYGRSLVELKQYRTAIAPLRFAADAHYELGQTNFYIARSYAGLNMDEIAKKYIGEAIANNFDDIESARQAPEFEHLQETSSFQQLLTQIEYPATTKPGGKIFDFLIGTWLYKTDEGAPAGQSTIAKTEKGYTVKETWTTGDCETTTSFHLQSEKGEWTYSLDGTDGRTGEGRINLIPNGIERVGVVIYPDGGIQFVKETLTRNTDSTVTITTQHSYDEGQTWVEVSRGILALADSPKPRPLGKTIAATSDLPSTTMSVTATSTSTTITITTGN